MDKQLYEVTEKAGSHVAGIAVEIGQRLPLTEDEARFEVLAGTIRPFKEEQREEEKPAAPEDPPAPPPDGKAGGTPPAPAGPASAGFGDGTDLAAGRSGGQSGGAAHPAPLKPRRKGR